MNNSLLRQLPTALFLCGCVLDCPAAEFTPADVHHSPVDIALAESGSWLVTANETANSVSLVGTSGLRVLDEKVCGGRPFAIEIASDQKTIVVSSRWSGELTVFETDGRSLTTRGRISVGFEPCGIAITPDGKRLFAGLHATGQVAEIDLVKLELTKRIDVGNWPRYLTLSPDGSRLAVGCAGDGRIHVLDAESGEVLYNEPLANGINLGHMTPSTDGRYAYFTWMVYRTNPIDVGNLRRGWLLASRIGRVRLDGPADREAISLDVPRMAVADPHGIVIADGGSRLVASAAGTHELLVYRLNDAPFVGFGGPGDLIDRGLQSDDDRFHRIPVGGRPMGLAASPDGKHVYVANHLKDSVQVVSLSERAVVDEVSLGRPEEISLARRGMEIFYDGQRSMDQWYSCHSCHQDGGVNSKAMDTWNDGTQMTYKTVLPLYDVTRTAPWTWHGWQTDLTEAMHKSITSTMLGRKPAEEDKQALIAYLDTLTAPPNPFAKTTGIDPAVLRGKRIFEGNVAACSSCHSGPHFTDGQIHDVGLGSPDDYYKGYNTPTLIGVYRKVRWLHSGRAKTLERVLKELHSPEKVSGTRALTDAEVQDLIAYLKTL